MTDPFYMIENESCSSQTVILMASFIDDEYISSPTEPATSESQKISSSYSSQIFVVRSRAFTDPSYHRPSRNKAGHQIAEAQSAHATDPEDLMQKRQTYLRRDQRDDWIEKGVIRSSKTGTNDPAQTSFSVGESIVQASKDQPGESKLSSDRVLALPEDREYIMQRFLREATHQPAGVLDDSTRELSCIADNVSGSIKHPRPQEKKSPLDPNLRVIGAFTEDFDEYEICAHRKSVSLADYIHSVSTDRPTLKPEALAKEYRAYESCFDKPHEKPNKLKDCTNSFNL